MGYIQGRERLSIPPPANLRVGYLDALSQAYGLGREHPIVSNLGRASKQDHVIDAVRARLGVLLGRDGRAMDALVWAAFYSGLVGAHPTRARTSWKCVIQQELAVAFTRLTTAYSAEVLEAAATFGLDASEWRQRCAGALAVARAAHVMAERQGHLYMPSLKEDMFEKIDLLYQPSRVAGGICFQVKASVSSPETVWEVVAPSDPGASGYVHAHRFVIGAEDVQRRNGGTWTPVMLTIGQRDCEPPAEVRACESVATAIRAMLRGFGRRPR